MSKKQAKQNADDSVPQVTVEHEAQAEPAIEATAELPVQPERDIAAMADPRNASSPMATDGPGVREESGAPEHGSGAPIPWPFSN